MSTVGSQIADEYLDVLDSGRAEELRDKIDAAVREEREKAAKLVEGWHISKGGFHEIAWQIRERG